MTRRQQVTEIEEEDDGPGAARGESFLNKPMPRWVARTLLALFILLAAIGISGFGRYHVYQKHFRETIPDAPSRFGELREGMTDKEVMALYPGLPWRCTYQDASSGLGDWVCFTSLNTSDGYPALGLTFFFLKKKLNLGMVQVPWWAHGRAQDAMRGFHGAPRLHQNLLRWRLANGNLDMDPSRSLNPVWWSAIVWTSPDGPRR